MRLFLLISAACVLAGAPLRAEDWPHWRGPNRNGTTSEASGYGAGAWPLGKTAWTRSLNATSESSPIIAGGRVYTMGHSDGSDRVYCLDAATGKEIWTQSYACRARGRNAVGDQSLYIEGPISTPEYDAETGYLYTLGVDGDLNCWNTRSEGKRVWTLNLYDRFGMACRPFTGGQVRDYGYTTSPLVYGNWLIVEAGGKEGNLVAFEKRTGGTPVGTPVWRSENKDPAGHSGGVVPMKVNGVPCAAVYNVFRLLVVRLDPGQEGKTVAEYPFTATCAASVVAPAVWNNLVVMSTHQGPGDDLVEVTLRGATRRGPVPHTEVGMPIYQNGRIYRGSGVLEGWMSNASASKRLWQADNFGAEGALILTGDNRLIAQGASKLALYGLDGAKLAETVGPRCGWPQPALSDGRLVCKDAKGELRCYLLRK